MTFDPVRAVTGDKHVGHPASCCDELVRPREALLVRQPAASTRIVRLHVACLTSELQAAPADFVDFPSAEILLARLTG